MRKLYVLAMAWCFLASGFAQVITSYPYSENFDTFPVDNISFGPGAEPNPFPNNWDNLQADGANQDWYGRSVATGSSNTGPSSDHTSGSGVYVYVEDGWGNYSDVTLESPSFYLNGTGTPVLIYYYHSRSATTTNNTMDVDVYSSSTNSWTTESTIGDDLNQWVSDTINLSAYNGDTVKIRFVGDNSTTSFYHDIAIDDFSIQYANFSATASVVQSNTCSSDSNGIATFSFLWNSGNVTASWSNGMTGDTASGLANGTYMVTLTDAANNTATATVTIGSTYNDPTFTTSSTDVLCNGGSTGTATVDSILTFNPFTPSCGDTSLISIDNSVVTHDTLGTGTTTNSTTGYPALFGNWYWGARHQLIFRASELTAQGMQAGYITSIQVPVTQINGTSNYSGFRVSLGCTSDSVLSSGWLSGLIEVRAPASHTVTTGWNTLSFDFPYYWDGTSNLVMETCFNNSGFTNNCATPYTNTGYTSTRYYRADISTVCGSPSTTGTSANRPNIVFDMSPFVPVPSITYAWSSSPNDTLATATGLSAGTYTVTVEDAFCSSEQTVNITEPPVLSATPSTTDALCFGDSSGTASLAITGGVGGAGATLLITETNPNSPDFVEIMNVSGSPVNVTGWKVVVSSSYTIINSANATTWNLTGTMAPGAVMYREDVTGANYWGNNIFWASGQSSWAMIIDNNNEMVDVVFWGWSGANISGFNPLVSGQSISLGNNWTGNGITASCGSSFVRTGTDDHNDASDWSCSTVSKGTANNGLVVPFAAGYSVTWSNSAMGNSVSNLAAGSYMYTVTDQNNCTVNGSVTISEPTAMTNSLSSPTLVGGVNVSCVNGDDGTVIPTTSGGTMPYDYLWTGPNGYMSLADTVNDAPDGTVYVMITDSNGCTMMDSIVLTAPSMALTLNADTVTNVSCFGLTDGSAEVSASGGIPGYTYSWTGGSGSSLTGLGASTYVITVTDTNGCEATTAIMVTQPAALAGGIDSLADAACNGEANGYASASVSGGTPGYTYAWTGGLTGAVQNSLPAGTYTVTMTDMNGCTLTATAQIDEPAAIELFPNVTNVNCAGDMDGQITLTTIGGAGGYSYAWDNSQTGDTITGLAVGPYVVTTTDAAGCIVIDTVNVNANSPTPMVNLGNDTSICEGGSVMLDAGTDGTQFTWSNGNIAQTITVSDTGQYWVEVRNIEGCLGTDTINISLRICVGVDEVSELGTIQYFPNPTDGLLNIRFEGNQASEVSMQVLDFTGKLILSKEWNQPGAAFTEQVDLSNHSQGMYFVNITLDGQRHTQRVVVY